MPATCVINGTILNLDGQPFAERLEARFTVLSTEQDLSGQMSAGVGVTSEPISAWTDALGVFSATLLQGAIVILEIPEIHLRKQITVPLQAGPVNFAILV